MAAKSFPLLEKEDVSKVYFLKRFSTTQWVAVGRVKHTVCSRVTISHLWRLQHQSLILGWEKTLVMSQGMDLSTTVVE